VAESVQWFRPTSGRVVGGLGVAAAAAVVVLALVDWSASASLPTAVGATLAGVLVWAAMLRPRVGLTGSTLVLRTMFETVHVPLAAIEQLVVRQFLAVRVGERRFVCPALGHSMRALMRAASKEKRGSGLRTPEPVTELKYADMVEQQIRAAAEEARAVAGVSLMSDEQLALGAGVRRDRAWLVLGVTVGLAIVLVLTILF
jgi:hypothetical protein